MKKFFIKIVCTLGIITLVVPPFFSFTPKAKAATTSLSGYIQDLSPVITKMPGCKKVIGAGVTDLFSSVKDLFSSKASKAEKAAEAKAEDEAMQEAMDAALQVVGVSDEQTRKGITDANIKLDAQKKAQESMENNQNCLNAIGKSIVKILINRLTESIVTWIQTGDDGGPLFVQDPGQFFGDIAKNQILGFGSEISDPNLFPFGKQFMQIQAENFKRKFQNNATYSMNEMIKSTTPEYGAIGFLGDFSQGGWAAWRAMSQYPGNNPLGFALLASNELAKRIESETELAAGSLSQSGGYLGVQKCVNPEGVTKEEHEAALKEMSAGPMGPFQNRLCYKWEIATPGKLVADEIGNTIMKKDSALLEAETLNDAMAAILDTVLAKFASSLQEDGLIGLNVENPYEINNVSGIGNFRNERDYSSAQINSSAWLEDHPDFDIRTDLNQALIDEQRIYMEKLELQNKEISSENEDPAYLADAPTGNYGLVPTIYQLDYCIPGPNPDWEDQSQAKLEDIQSELSQVQFSSGNDEKWWQFIDDLTGNIIGGLVDSIEALAYECGSPEAKKAWHLYFSSLSKMTGLTFIAAADSNGAFCAIDGFIDATDRIQQEYKRNIDVQYDFKYLPSVAREAKTKYGQIDNYLQIKKDNEYTIDNLTSVVRRLENIKMEIDALNCRLDPASTGAECSPKITTSEEYEAALAPWKNAFARISSNLYSGDDIANTDKATKQIIDEKDYVYNNLIKSLTGCEEESSHSIPYPYSWQFEEYKRPNYPEVHLYEYPNTVINDKNSTNYKRTFLGDYLRFWDRNNCGEPSNTVNQGGNNNCGAPNGSSIFNITNPLANKGDPRLAAEGCTNEPPLNKPAYCTDHNQTGIIDITDYVDLRSPGWDGSAYYWEQALGIY